MAVGAGLAASGATVLGGLIAYRWRRALGGLMAFGNGVVLGVAAFDLLPEALILGRGSRPGVVTVAIAALGLGAYLVLGRLDGAGRRGRGGASRFSVPSLVLHSFLDGVGVGGAFLTGAPLGFMVALGVVAHDLVDGSNTVAFSLDARLSGRATLGWLALDGLAPVAGVLLSAAIRPASGLLSIILAVMAGGFAFIGVSHLLPRIRGAGRAGALALAAAGLGLVLASSRLAAG